MSSSSASTYPVDDEILLPLLPYLLHPQLKVKKEALKILQLQLEANKQLFSALVLNIPQHYLLQHSLLPLLPSSSASSSSSSSSSRQSSISFLSLLVQLIASHEDIVLSTLQILLFLSQDLLLVRNLLQLHLIEILIEQIRVSSACTDSIVSSSAASSCVNTSNLCQIVDNCIKILANLTREDEGVQILLKVDHADADLIAYHVKYLISLYLRYSSHTNDDKIHRADSGLIHAYDYISHVLLNITQNSVGRQFLLQSSMSLSLEALSLSLLPSANLTRQFAILSLFRNLFLETANHSTLIAHRTIMVRILLIVTDAGQVREEECKGMPQELYRKLKSSSNTCVDTNNVSTLVDTIQQGRGSKELRLLVLEILLLCARHAPSRLGLKSIAIYPIIREWHLFEHSLACNQVSNADPDIDSMLYDLVPYFILEEEEAVSETVTNEAEKSNESSNVATNSQMQDIEDNDLDTDLPDLLDA